MDWLFVHLKNNGWWLKITTDEQLLEYYKNIVVPKLRDGLDRLMQSKEYGPADSKRVYGEEHAMHPFSYIIGDHGSFNKQSPLIATIDVGNMLFENMHNALIENGTILINSNGGFCWPMDDMPQDQYLRRDKLVFPGFTKNDIRIKKFTPDSEHWYAYIGDLELKNEDGTPFKSTDYKVVRKKAKEYILNN